ncbi:hypothetical protein HY489_05125 [Candidatus Woesearchaeota archaeon]|nr:hypothetical protein [Candidatus Woesearchaeota archaeon]
MINVYLHGPHWFLGVDAALEALAGVIALLVAFASYKAWRLTGERKYGWFTVSISLLTVSFLSRALTDALLREVFIKLPERIAGLVFYAGYVTHIMLAFLGYIILIAITHKIHDRRIVALLFLTLVPSLLMSGSYYRTFYGLSLVFLAFITLAYYQNYKRVGNKASALVFEAFALLTAAQVQFLVQGFYILSTQAWNFLFVTAHVTQTLGFVFLLAALLRLKSAAARNPKVVCVQVVRLKRQV